MMNFWYAVFIRQSKRQTAMPAHHRVSMAGSAKESESGTKPINGNCDIPLTY